MATREGGDERGGRPAPRGGNPAAGAPPGPGAPAAAPKPARRNVVLEAPLTGLTVGMWRSRRHRACQLLLLPGQAQLVVLCDRRTMAPRSPSRFSLAAVGLTAKSPFASGHSAYRSLGCVHAFEVPFHSIRGMDYSNPLCHEARLVLETVGLRKREFPTMEAAREYFLEPISPSQPEGAPGAIPGLPASAHRTRTTSRIGSGLLQEALQAQAAALGSAASIAAQLAPASPAATGAGASAAVAAPAAAAPAAGPGPGSAQQAEDQPLRSNGVGSAAKASLLPRLDASLSTEFSFSGAPNPAPSAASQPLSIAGGPAQASGPVDLAAAAAAAEASRSSFERARSDGSYESDPGSPASGSLWYWGSPSCPRFLSPASSEGAFSVRSSSQLSQSPAMLGPRHSSSQLSQSPAVLGRPQGRAGGLQGASPGSSGSHSSWEDLAGPGPGSAEDGSRSRSQPPRRQSAQQQQPEQQEQPGQRRKTLTHVGSAPAQAGFFSPQLQRSAGSDSFTFQPCAPAASGMHRVASDGQLRTASLGRPAPAAGTGQQPPRPAEEGWPAAHAFTTVSKVYSYRTVVLHWTDLRLPGMLRPIIQGNERLLRLHESGLPAWAVYAPQYGLWYRPWLRTLTWVFFYAFSIFSFAVGFYDLYKVVPGLQVVMQRLMASVWLPPAAVLEWLEQHTQIRLSILLTYLFGKSQAFVWLMRWAQHFARVAQAALRPVADVLGPPAALVAQAASAVGVTLGAILRAGLAPIAALLLQLWTVLGAAVLPLVQLLHRLVVGPLAVMGTGFRQISWAAGTAWAALAQAGASVAAGAAALAGTAKAGSAVGGATTQALAGQALWFYVIPADALEVLRTSAVKVAKAAQAVFKFCLQICDNVVRHRLTLSLKAGRAWRRTKARLRSAAAVPVRLATWLLAWLIVAFRVVFLDRLPAAQQGSLPAAEGEGGSSSGPAEGQQQQQPREPPDGPEEAVPAGEPGGVHSTAVRHRLPAAAAGGDLGPAAAQEEAAGSEPPDAADGRAKSE